MPFFVSTPIFCLVGVSLVFVDVNQKPYVLGKNNKQIPMILPLRLIKLQDQPLNSYKIPIIFMIFHHIPT